MTPPATPAEALSIVASRTADFSPRGLACNDISSSSQTPPRGFACGKVSSTSETPPRGFGACRGRRHRPNRRASFPVGYSRLPIACLLLNVVYCLLPSFCCLLPIACCLLLIASPPRCLDSYSQTFCTHGCAHPSIQTGSSESGRHFATALARRPRRCLSPLPRWGAGRAPCRWAAGRAWRLPAASRWA